MCPTPACLPSCLPSCLPASLESPGRISSGPHWYGQGPRDLSAISLAPAAAVAAIVVSDAISAFLHSVFIALSIFPANQTLFRSRTNCLSLGAHHSCVGRYGNVGRQEMHGGGNQSLTTSITRLPSIQCAAAPRRRCKETNCYKV